MAGGSSDAQNTFNQWATACDPDTSGNCTYAHRQNMLSANFRVIGIGRAYNGNSSYGWYWTTDFGGYVDQVINPNSTPAIASFTANPSTITPGQPTTLSWSVSGASSISLDNGVGDVSNLTSKTVSPTQTTTYTLTAANSAGSATARTTVTVNSVVVTSPANNQTVSGTITISVSAADNVASVQFKLDGQNLGPEETSSPYSLSWDTTGTANGSHLLTAAARDAAGNTTISSEVSVEVSNNSGGGGSSGGGSAGSSGGGGGGGCFIATAAYGSALAPQVVFLQAFRDRYLISAPAGRAFVQWYYHTSPPIAEKIRQSPSLRVLVQGGLWPLVGIVWLILHPWMGVGLLAGVVFGFWAKWFARGWRRRGKGQNSRK